MLFYSILNMGLLTGSLIQIVPIASFPQKVHNQKPDGFCFYCTWYIPYLLISLPLMLYGIPAFLTREN